jgi:hypothetical protein
MVATVANLRINPFSFQRRECHPTHGATRRMPVSGGAGAEEPSARGQDSVGNVVTDKWGAAGGLGGLSGVGGTGSRVKGEGSAAEGRWAVWGGGVTGDRSGARKGRRMMSSGSPDVAGCPYMLSALENSDECERWRWKETQLSVNSTSATITVSLFHEEDAGLDKGAATSATIEAARLDKAAVTSAVTCSYPALTRCCTKVGCAKSTWVYMVSETIVALQLSVQRSSLLLSRSSAAAVQTDNLDALILRAAAILTPSQQQLCLGIALCRRQINASEIALLPPPSLSQSFTSVLGFVPLGACEGGLLGRVATCQECVTLDGCHYCAQQHTCLRNYTKCIGDPWSAVVSHGKNPYGWVVSCPPPSAGGGAVGGASEGGLSVVSYLGGIAASTFIDQISNTTRDGGANVIIRAYTPADTCLKGSCSPHGLPPCAQCEGGTYSDQEYLNDKCHACPNGWFSLTGSSSIHDCRPGCQQGWSSPIGFSYGDIRCKACERGKFAQGFPPTSCSHCPVEYFTSYVAARGAEECQRVQLGVDRVLKAGRKVFVSVWFVSMPFAHKRDTVTVCKVVPPSPHRSAAQDLDACRVLAWAFTSQKAPYKHSESEPYVPGTEAFPRGAIELDFDSAGEGLYEIRFFSHLKQAILLSSFWNTMPIVGLRWEQISDSKVSGRTADPTDLIVNALLEEALKTKLAFGEEEFSTFGLSDLSLDRYVKVAFVGEMGQEEMKYFMPAVPTRVMPLLEGGNEDLIVPLPDDTGWELVGDEAGPYRFPLSRVHPELEMAVSPRCQYTRTHARTHAHTHTHTHTHRCMCADLMRPRSCAVVKCSEIPSCIEPPVFAPPVVLTVLATRLGLPSVYNLTCQEGFLRVLQGTNQQHARQVVVISCTPQADWQGDGAVTDIKVSCMSKENVTPLPSSPPITRPKTTARPMTTPATTAGSDGAVVPAGRTTAPPVTTPAPGSSNTPLLTTTTPAPVDWGQVMVDRDISGLMISDSAGSRPGCDTVFLHMEGVAEDEQLSTVFHTHICAAEPSGWLEWQIEWYGKTVDIQVHLSQHSLLGGRGGIANLQHSQNVQNSDEPANAAGLGVVFSPEGASFDARYMYMYVCMYTHRERETHTQTHTHTHTHTHTGGLLGHGSDTALAPVACA